MVENVANLISLAIGVFAVIAFIYGIVKSDGKGCYKGDWCNDCPMPCDFEVERREREEARLREQKKQEKIRRKAKTKRRV